MSTLAAPVGSTRVVAVGDPGEMARGRPAEFRHRGLSLASRPSAVSALLEVSREPESVVLVSTQMSDMPLVAFVDVVRSLAHSPVLVGMAEGCPAHLVSELLEHGASGAVALPVTPTQLAAAVATTRRAPLSEQFSVQVGELRLDAAQHRVTWGDAYVPLGRKEFEVLRIMMSEYPRVLSLAALAEALDDGSDEQSVRVAASRMRAKFGAVRPSKAPILETVHRIGYRICP